MQKIVSVIIPTYSRSTFITRAIDSILGQTYHPIEIIVVDDNGKGTPQQIETQKILQTYIDDNKIRYITHERNKNGSAARNTGIEASRGEYVTFLDDDDEYLPEKIAREVEAIEHGGEEVGGSYCGHRKSKGSVIVSERKATKSGNLQKETLLQQWGFGTGSNPLFKREVFEKVGLFDVAFKRKQDVEFIIRFFRQYKIVNVPEVLVIKHIESQSNRPSAKAFAEVVRVFLSTFENDIKAYPSDVSNEIYFRMYIQNAFFALTESEYRFAFKTIRKALEYKSLTVKDILRIIKYIFVKKTIR